MENKYCSECDFCYLQFDLFGDDKLYCNNKTFDEENNTCDNVRKKCRGIHFKGIKNEM